jgi:hypothetical protein
MSQINVTLCDDQNQPAVYIVDTDLPGYDLHLVIWNRSDDPFVFQAPSTKSPSKKNRHVEIRFRPGVIAPSDAQNVQITRRHRTSSSLVDWQLDHDIAADGEMVFFLLQTSKTELGSGESLHLTIGKIRAEAAGGSRGSRVEIRMWSDPGDSGKSADRQHVRRQQLIRIRQRRGQPDLPLHVDWQGAGQIINDGQTLNSLVLQLFNTSRTRPISLDRTSLDADSKLILSFDASHDDPIALTSLEQLRAMKVTTRDPGWEIRAELMGQVPEWIIRPIDRDRLEPRQLLEIEISELISDALTGRTFAYLRYENIPGYWDGDLTIPLTKSCLSTATVEDSKTGNKLARVGVGTAEPQSELDVRGVVRAEALRIGGVTITEREWQQLKILAGKST